MELHCHWWWSIASLGDEDEVGFINATVPCVNYEAKIMSLDARIQSLVTNFREQLSEALRESVRA